MTRLPRPAISNSLDADYGAGLAQVWASLEQMQRWGDDAPDGPRSLEEPVQDFLQSEEPYPVEYLDDSGTVFRDHSELCPTLWPAR